MKIHRIILTLLTVVTVMAHGIDADARTKSKTRTKARTEQKSTARRAAAPAEPRTAAEVKRERQRTEQEIADTRRQISQNDKETSRQLNRLNLINARISQREDTIRGISRQLDSVTGSIAQLDDTIGALNTRAAALKSAYAVSLRQARARRQSMDYLSFIFSAKTFEQAWRRLRYLNELSKTTTRQAIQIKHNTQQLTEAKARLDNLRTSRTTSLASLNRVQNGQKREQADAGRLVANLKKEGASLNRELNRRREQAAALDRELNRIVEQEIRAAEARRAAEEKARREAAAREARERAAREAREREAAERAAADRARQAQQPRDAKTGEAVPKPAEKPSAKPSRTVPRPKPEDKATEKPVVPPPAEKQPEKQPEKVAEKPAPKTTSFDSQAEADRRLTGSFESNKGRLLFPVAGRYTVVSQFGTYDHPDLQKVKVNSLGIDVEVPRGSTVRSVFEGVVSSIFRLDGYHNVIIVRHGDYLTVYGGIDGLSVKKGDKVRTGQTIGTLYSDPDDGGRTRLHFEIRHEKTKLNPAEWVR